MSRRKSVAPEFEVSPSRVVSIRREGAPRGFRFIAKLDDGTEIVLRKKTALPYTWATQWSESRNPRYWAWNSATGLWDFSDVRGYFTFHSKPQGDGIARNIAVEIS